MSSQTLYAPQPKRPRPSQGSRAGPSSVSGTGSSNGSYGSRSAQLPYDLIEYIFTLLPIIYTIRAGLVAKRFKNTWRLSRRLHFERDLGFQHDPAHFRDIINHVFLHHKGPEIKSFRVFVEPQDIEFFLSTWVDKCIEKGVDELQLDIYQSIKYQPHLPTPCNFSDIETLRVLHISNSVVHLPPQLNGLSLLTTLVLRDVIVLSREIEAILDRCALLETLDMAQCCGFRTLRILAGKHRRFRVFKLGGCGSEVAGIFIDAPTLRCLYYDGNLCNLGFHVFKPMLRMHEAILNFAPSRVFTNPWQIERIVSQICNVKVLTINSTFLEGLAPRIVDGQFKQMEFTFGNLTELQLILDNTSFCNLGDITCFLKNCPNIEKLFIEANDKFIFHEGPYWELHQDLVVMKNYFGFFNNIKVIKIKGFQFQIHFMELVKFLLGKAMFLESMVLVLPNNLRFTSPRYMDYFGDLLNSWRVSYQGQISIYIAYDDRSGVEPQQSKMWYR